MQERSEKNTSECLFYQNTGATQDNGLRFDSRIHDTSEVKPKY